jgi:hypothetical protein
MAARLRDVALVVVSISERARGRTRRRRRPLPRGWISERVSGLGCWWAGSWASVGLRGRPGKLLLLIFFLFFFLSCFLFFSSVL